MSQPLTLLPRQEVMLSRAWRAFVQGKPRVLCAAVTGFGKTVVMDAFIRKAGCKTLVLCGREKLARQLVSRIGATGIWSASLGSKFWGDVTVGTIGSIPDVLPNFKLIIVDEAHNVSGLYERLAERMPEARWLGFTATPFGCEEFWPHVADQVSYEEAWEMGLILKPTCQSSREQFDLTGVRVRGGDYAEEDLAKLASDEKRLRARVADALERLGPRRKRVWCCVNIDHAERVWKEIGGSAAIVHSKQLPAVQENYMREFTDGSARDLVFVSIVSEGYDFPPIDAVVLMRPMRSPRMYLQTVGRGLRTYEGKSDCLVLDYGRVIENLGAINRVKHLGKGKKFEKKPETGDPVIHESLWHCKKCFGFNELTDENCKHCGKPREFPEPVRALSTMAESAHSIVATSPIEVTEPDSCEITQHTARSSGNRCIKVTYRKGFAFQVMEFFTAHPFSWEKGSRRLAMLGLPEDMSFDEAWEWVGSGLTVHPPAKIETERDGKYDRVRKVYRAQSPRVAESPAGGLCVEGQHNGGLRSEVGVVPEIPF